MKLIDTVGHREDVGHKLISEDVHRHAAHGISHNVDYFPRLKEILAEDASILLGRRTGPDDVEGVPARFTLLGR